jgi:hypothetical protein
LNQEHELRPFKTSSAGLRAAAAVAVLLIAPACAPGVPARPSGTASDDPSAVAALASATTHCRPLRTASAELRLSGRAAGSRIRARMVAGFAEPESVRVEVLAPFGAPALILASDGATTTLLFPRERQVLRDAPVSAVLDALTGLALDGGELRRVLLGCLTGTGGTGRRYGDVWQEVVDGETRVYLRRGVPVATDYRGWQIDYADHDGGIARTVRVRRAVPAGPIDLVAAIGQLEMNVVLDARAFVVDVPADADPLTLDDLRRSSPLVVRSRSE